MNNNNDNKENDNSLFSRFENALNRTINGDDEEVEDEVTEEAGVAPGPSNNYERRDYDHDNSDDYDTNIEGADSSDISDSSDVEETLNRDGMENMPNQENRFRQNSGDNFGDAYNPSNPNNFNRNRMPNLGNNGDNDDDDNPVDEIKDRIADEATKKLRDEATKKLKEKAAEKVAEKGAEQVAAGAGETVAAGGGAAATGGAAAAGGGAAAAGGGAAAVGGGAAAAGTGAAVAGGGAAAAGTGAAVAGGTVAAGEGAFALLSNPVGWVILGVIAAIIIVVILLIIVIAIAVYRNSLTDIKVEDGYALIDTEFCEYVTVTDCSDPSNNGTYPYETYIAGVTSAEVGMFNNLTVSKVFAVAARNFFYNNNKNCTIKGNATKQAFRKPDALGLSAAKATEGVVMITDGKIQTAQYDAFAYKSEDANNYYIKQKDQAIPKSWANGKKSLINSLSFYKTHSHGRGMSQWGALYLAETGKSYEEILKYYYGDLTLAKAASTLVFNPDIELTKTPGGYKNILTEPLDQFLPKHGSSIAAYNNAINKAVNEAGYGTRNGVVAAGYSLITIMDQNFHKRLPYANGGHYQMWASHFSSYTNPLGVDGGWGTPGVYKWVVDARYYGIDCNAFVSWAMFNGGYKYFHFSSSANTTKSELAAIGINTTTCSAGSSSCVGKPGDLLFSSGHIMLIVGSNESKYFVAESSGREVGMKVDTRPRTSTYTVMDMSNYYSKQARR